MQLIPIIKKLIKDSFLAQFFYPHFYSQTGEDAIVHQILGKTSGSYIDVGSGRPIWYSNTYFFYKRGWRGILIDPINYNVEISKRIRKRDLVIHGAVGSFNSKSEFYELDPYVYSTFEKSNAEYMMKLGVKLKSNYKLTCYKIHELSKMHNQKKPVILNLDTEGFELDILAENDWAEFSPEIIMVEELTNPISNHSTIREYLNSVNYELYAYTGLTSIYLNKSFRTTK